MSSQKYFFSYVSEVKWKQSETDPLECTVVFIQTYITYITYRNLDKKKCFWLMILWLSPREKNNTININFTIHVSSKYSARAIFIKLPTFYLLNGHIEAVKKYRKLPLNCYNLGSIHSRKSIFRLNERFLQYLLFVKLI